MLPVQDVRESFACRNLCDDAVPKPVRVPTESFKSPILVTAVAAIIWLIGVASAQGPLATSASERIEPSPQSLILPGTNYEIRVGRAERGPDQPVPSQALLRAIVV